MSFHTDVGLISLNVYVMKRSIINIGPIYSKRNIVALVRDNILSDFYY